MDKNNWTEFLKQIKGAKGSTLLVLAVLAMLNFGGEVLQTFTIDSTVDSIRQATTEGDDGKAILFCQEGATAMRCLVGASNDWMMLCIDPITDTIHVGSADSCQSSKAVRYLAAKSESEPRG